MFWDDAHCWQQTGKHACANRYMIGENICQHCLIDTGYSFSRITGGIDVISFMLAFAFTRVFDRSGVEQSTSALLAYQQKCRLRSEHRCRERRPLLEQHVRFGEMGKFAYVPMCCQAWVLVHWDIFCQSACRCPVCCLLTVQCSLICQLVETVMVKIPTAVTSMARTNFYRIAKRLVTPICSGSDPR